MHSSARSELITIEVWSDIACPWATLAIHRFRRARAELGIANLVLSHHAFPLELINSRATPRPVIDHEIEIIVELTGIDWKPFARDSWEYPGSVLAALDAVQAARLQRDARASEELDWALREAFYRDSRPIGLLTEVFAIAAEVPEVDEHQLRIDMQAGAGRAKVLADNDSWRPQEIQGSPVFVLPSGERFHNPGIRLRWTPAGDVFELEVLQDNPHAVAAMLATINVGTTRQPTR